MAKRQGEELLGSRVGAVGGLSRGLYKGPTSEYHPVEVEKWK